MFNFIFIAILSSALTLSSPDGTLSASINPSNDALTYNLTSGATVLTEPSQISMTLSTGEKWPSGRLISANRKSVDTTFDTPLYKKSSVRDCYNELRLKYKDCSVVFRLYDDAFAWRFEASGRRPYKVESEQACFRLPEDWNIYATYTHKYAKHGLDGQYCDDFENVYEYFPISQWNKSHFATCPLMIEASEGIKMVITESDLVSYPGMFLYNEDGGKGICGKFAAVPSEFKIAGHNGLQEMVTGRHDYIASCDGAARTFPWRIICISHSDIEMADNDAVIRLASAPDKGADFSWVKPGRVAWDWLNSWGLRGLDFKPGINTETYKYYIDFASRHGIEYVILDEGWSIKGKNDLFEVVPEINLEEIISHGIAKGVDIILWAGHYPFAKDMENVCRHYSRMGVKGFKIDFMNRDDQLIEDFMSEAAATCAKYHMILDFHGTHKPVGLQRKYPNIVNCEGIFGMEQMRNKNLPEYDMVETDVLVPYIRYVAGFADYTPGLMRNASRENFRPVKTEPMSQGTRCHQLAQYIIFDAPLNMLADSPSNYEQEKECLDFIARIPTVWDETRILSGRVGEYIVTARRSGGTWYVGAMTDWTERDLEVDLSSLFDAPVKADMFIDGYSADKIACDYRHISMDGDGKCTVHLAPGGGFAAIITKK
ncbi:MAG: glycoside hydrolase family 97 protein [Bacteroidales bacterium]|nr:glycoside hydrolase family 97 protein [Bacteroidales bacterium]